MKIKKEVKIGIYFFVILALFVWGVNYLSGRDIFKSSKTFYAMYDNVEGLQKSSQVFVKGLKVGAVQDIKYDQKKDKFIVSFSVTSNYAVPVDSEIQLSSDILGNKSLRLILGDNTQDFLKNDDLISSAVEFDVISSLTNDLPNIKDTVKLMLSKLDTTLNSVNEVLSEKNVENISNIIAHLANTMGNLEQVSGTINQSKSKIAGIISNAESITSNIKSNNEKISNTISNLYALSDTLKSMQLTGTINEVNSVLAKINSGEGSIQF